MTLDYEFLYDEAQSPANYGGLKSPTHRGNHFLERCRDTVLLQLIIKEDKILEVGWTGQGCTMCRSSASLMTRELVGLSRPKALELAIAFTKMMNGAPPDPGLSETLRLFESVSRNAMKAECVLVPWIALRNAI